jgi:hypothetical protein
MSKRKNFRHWYEEEDRDGEEKFRKKDSKRYDAKKSAIQRARKQKAKQKNSLLS